MYQQARRLANEQKYDEAKLLFQDIKGIDFEQWGTDCDEWLAKLVNYEQIVELVQDASTLEHARGAWQKYVRRYGDDFDPYPVKPLIVETAQPKNLRVLLALVGIGMVALVFVASQIFPFNPREVGAVPTFTEVVAASQTQIAVAITASSETSDPTITPSFTDEPTNTPSPTLTPSPTSTYSITPDFTSTTQYLEGLFTQTMDVFLMNQAATQNANLTLVALSWTPTFTLTPTPSSTWTPNIELTDRAIETQRTQISDAATREHIATVDALEQEQSPTFTATWTLSPIATPTYTLVELARNFAGSNNDWNPIEADFNGVPMVLVPVGCFQMGSATGNSDERPVNRVCIENPFWIDVYEVNYSDYNPATSRYGPGLGFTGQTYIGNYPVVGAAAGAADGYCRIDRSGRLPTEAEWEYAGRGPDGLEYPWGDSFVAENVVFGENSSGWRAEQIGSRPSDLSWVGAYDLAGNVREWTRTIYSGFTYPYTDDDGRNPVEVEFGSVLMTVRGGGWDSTADQTRLTNRHGVSSSNWLNNTGFRCVREYN